MTCARDNRQQSWIGGLDRARCDDIGNLSGDVMISSCLWHEGYSVRIEDPVGRGGSCIRSLNVAFDTGLVLLLILKDLL